MFTDNADRLKKQNYLREHILDKGLDPEKFCEFLESMQDSGSDVDNWTLNDIETLVDLFKRSEDDPQTTSKYKLQEFDLEDTEDEIYSKRISTKQMPPNLLGTLPLTVSINEHSMMSGGFFSSDYVLFDVKLSKMNTIAKRRAADFQWLHNTLVAQFSASMVPPVFKTSEKLTDKATIIEQKMVFKTFLNDILANPELRMSTCVEAFLFVKTQDEFTAKKKTFTKMFSAGHPRTTITRKNIQNYPQELPKLSNFGNTKGATNLKICKNLKNFYHGYQDYLQTADQLMSKISRLSKDLLVGMDNVRTIMSDLSEYFSLMHQLNSEFNQNCPVGKDKVQEKTFFSLQNVFNCWSDVTNGSIKNIDKHFSKFFEYWKAEIGQLKELVKTRNVISSEYYKNKKELNDKKKVKLVTEPAKLHLEPLQLEKACLKVEDVQGSEELFKKFIIPEETKQVRLLADYFGLFNNKIFEQQQRFNEYRNKKSIDNFVRFANDQVKLVTQQHLIWAELTSHMSDYKERVDQNLQQMDLFLQQGA